MRRILIITLLSALVLASCEHTKGITGTFGVTHHTFYNDTLQIEIFPDGFVLYSNFIFDDEFHVSSFYIREDSLNHYSLLESQITNKNIPLKVIEKKHHKNVISFEKLNPCFHWYLILNDTVIQVTQKKMPFNDDYKTIQLMGVYKEELIFREDTIMTEKKQIDCNGCEIIVDIDKRYYSLVHYIRASYDRIVFSKDRNELTTIMSQQKMKRLKKPFFDWEEILNRYRKGK